MEGLILVIVIAFFALFIGLLAYAIRSGRKEQRNKQEWAAMLGFSAVQPDAMLAQKIVALYRNRHGSGPDALRNVSRKTIPGGVMYLFDLVDTSGESDSTAESQGVAVISPDLRLPQFMLLPRMDEQQRLGKLANRVIAWGANLGGDVLTFPEYPAFDRRYLVITREMGATQDFFDEAIAAFFSATEMTTLHAGGDTFTLSEIRYGVQKLNQEVLAARVGRAMEVYRVLGK